MNIMANSPVELTETRKIFEKDILDQYKYNPRGYEWKTKAWIQKKIHENDTTERYIIEEKDGVKVVRIAKAVRGRGMQIVPIEDYFDVLYAAHIFTGHGKIETMRQHLENKRLYVPTKAILCLLKLCGPCNAIKLKNRDQILTYHGFLELIDMSRIPDGDSRFVMHYRALKLNRVYLRALSSSDAMEVAEQLLKLFAQIGPPRMLHTPTMSFTKAVIQRLAIICPKYKIICGREMQFDVKSSQIRTNIKKWMKRSYSTEWSKGIHTLTAFGFRRKQIQVEDEVENGTDEGVQGNEANLPGPSTSQDTKSKKLEHELFCQNNISADEVFQLLTPSLKTYNNTRSTRNTEATFSKQEATFSKQGQKRDYSRKSKNKPEITILPVEKKEEPIGEKVLCIDQNLKALNVKMGKKQKKFHEIWNSALDLPEEDEQTKKTRIGKNMIEPDIFGIIPKEDGELLDDTILYNEVGQLSFSQRCKKRDSGASTNVPALKYEEENVEEQQEDSKKEIKLIDIKDDFKTEEKCFNNISDLITFESDPIKEEPIDFDIPSNVVSMVDIKEEDASLASIVKVESLYE